MSEFADKLAALTDDQLYALFNKKNQQSKLVAFCKKCYTTPDKSRALTQSLKLLEQSNLINQVCSELVGVIVSSVSDLTGDELQTLGQGFITSLKQGQINSGKSLEVLSALLSVVEVRSSVEEFTGPEYKSHLINQIASVRWSESSLLPLITTLRDVNLTQTEIQFVTAKALTSIATVPHSDLPPIVYQLLLYANKPSNTVTQKRKILAGIVKHFDELDKSVSSNEEDMSADIMAADPEELWSVEGTCLLHIVYAIKHDLVLGKALNQHLKDLKDYTPFSVALALSFSQLPRFTDKVLTSLKTGITRNLKTKKLWDLSNFVRGKFVEPVDIRAVLTDVIMRSGWDHVTQGLISLAFLLLDIPDTADEPSVAAVGVVMLEQCYKLHSQCKTEVFNQLLHRIVTSTPLPSDKHSKLLNTLSRRSLQLMMAQTNKLKDSLSHVPLIPLKNAIAVLSAFVPVMRYQVQLRDYAIVIFRKALFSKDQNSRVIAVIGLTEMLKSFKVGESCSQQSQLSCSQVQVHMMVTDDVHEAVCTEILLLLKRALTLQGGVRCELYQRLPSVLSANPLLSPMILQLLHDHLTPLYESDEGILPPLKLSSCIHVLPDHSLLREPLPDLLLCVIQCVQEASHCHTLEQLQLQLTSIAQRCTKSDLEDWDLDKAAEFSTTGVGSRNCLTALTLSALLEVVLEYTLIKGESTVQSSDQFKKLFKIFNSLQDLIKDKQGAPKFGRKTKHSYFSTKGLQFLLNALICDEQPEHEEFVIVMRTISHCLTWSLGLALEKIKLSPQTTGQISDEGKAASQTLSFFAQCMLTHLSKPGTPYRETGATVLTKCVVTMTTLHSQFMEEFLPEGLWKRLQGLFEAAVEAEDYSEATSYLTAIRAVTVHEPPEELCDWLEGLIKTSSMNSGLAKEVVSLVYTLHRLSKDNLALHTLLATDILTVCGDVEVEEAEEEAAVHSLVTRQSASRIAAVTAAAVDRVVHDIELCLQLGCNEDQADALCLLLLQAAQVAVPLLSARISHGAPLDLTIKCAKQLYTTLTVFIKHETSAVAARNTLRSLEKLAKYVGQSLNPALYSSLNYLQTDSSGGGKKTVSTVKRQAISVPGVVYAVEQCERHLILLSTKAKTVDLMEHFKRSTARDFRIVTSVVEQTLNKEERPKKKRKKNDSSSASEAPSEAASETASEAGA